MSSNYGARFYNMQQHYIQAENMNMNALGSYHRPIVQQQINFLQNEDQIPNLAFQINHNNGKNEEKKNVSQQSDKKEIEVQFFPERENGRRVP